MNLSRIGLLLTLFTLSSCASSNKVIHPNDLAVGPGLAGINMNISRMGNSQFKKELLAFNINGTTIQKGETRTGLIGIKADSYESILLKVN